MMILFKIIQSIYTLILFFLVLYVIPLDISEGNRFLFMVIIIVLVCITIFMDVINITEVGCLFDILLSITLFGFLIDFSNDRFGIVFTSIICFSFLTIVLMVVLIRIREFIFNPWFKLIERVYDNKTLDNSNINNILKKYR